MAVRNHSRPSACCQRQEFANTQPFLMGFNLLEKGTVHVRSATFRDGCLKSRRRQSPWLGSASFPFSGLTFLLKTEGKSDYRPWASYDARDGIVASIAFSV